MATNQSVPHSGNGPLHPETDFVAAMAAAGLSFSGHLIPDGRLHRIKVNGDHNPNAWYVLHLDGLPAGSFGCWKRGFTETWCAKSGDTLTAEERAERDRKWKRQQAERDAERQRAHDEARAQGKKILDAARPATDDHPYLLRKGVHSHPGVMTGAWPQRQRENCLLIPLRTASGQLTTVQAIFPNKPSDGRDKDFLRGGAKQGAFFAIGDLATAPVVIIAEGYSTAATLHEVTGHPTVMAIDAGNLLPVAEALRALYPSTRIIIAADNDRATHDNPGVRQATDAAKAIHADLAIPQFAEGESGTDFNDLARLRGADVVRQAIEQARPVADESRQEDADDWRNLLLRDSDKKVVRTHYNAVLIAEHAFPGLIGFNEFTGRIEARLATPWRKTTGPWTDYDTQELAFHLVSAPLNLPAFRLEMLDVAIQTAARRHPFNPAQERLRALAGQWDGVTRLDSWLTRYLNAEVTVDNRAYLEELGPAWLKGVCARVLFPGCKRDDVLALVGAQGFVKSGAAQAIADCIMPNTFTDSLGNLGSDEAAIGVQGIIVAEFAELAAMGRSELEAVKAFISRPSDRYRPKYARLPIDQPRTCSFIATTNEDCGFLRDPSGNRRWWPITVTQMIDLPALKEALPLLMGEAASRVIAGEPWHVSDEEALRQAESVRSDCADSDVWEPAVLNTANRLSDRDRTIGNILAELGLNTEHQDRRSQTRVSNILRANGYQRRRGRDSTGQRGYMWVKLSPMHKEGGQKGDRGLASEIAAVPPVPICPYQEKNHISGLEHGGGEAQNSAGKKKSFIGNRGDKGGQGTEEGQNPRAKPGHPPADNSLPTGATADARALWEVLRHVPALETAARLAENLGWSVERVFAAAQELRSHGRASVNGAFLAPIHPPTPGAGQRDRGCVDDF